MGHGPFRCPERRFGMFAKHIHFDSLQWIDGADNQTWNKLISYGNLKLVYTKILLTFFTNTIKKNSKVLIKIKLSEIWRPNNIGNSNDI